MLFDAKSSEIFQKYILRLVNFAQFRDIRLESDPYGFLGLLDLNSHLVVQCHKLHEQLPRSRQIALLLYLFEEIALQ